MEPRKRTCRTGSHHRVLAGIGVAVLLASSAGAVELPGAGRHGPLYLPDRLIVKYRARGTPAGQAAALARASLRETERLRHVGLTVARAEMPGQDLDASLARLALDPAVEWAEKIPLARYQLVPPDPDFSAQWPLRNTGQTGGTPDADIDAVEAWDVEDGSAHPIVVAVIDSGLDYTHPDLAGNVWTNPGEDAWSDPLDPSTGNGVDDDGNGRIDDWKGWDFVGANLLLPVPDNDPLDALGHGTHVAGIIAAASNDQGGVGVDFHARLLPIKIGDNSEGLNSLMAIVAIDYLIDLKTRSAHPEPDLRVINASWGQLVALQAMKTAIEAAGEAGILFVCAAGNGGFDQIGDDIDHPGLLEGNWPAAFDSDSIVSVAATDHHDALASFSNYGAVSVDLAAPGVSYFATMPTYEVVLNTEYGYSQDYDFLSGTSMASPCVAGAAALFMAKNPSLGLCEIKSLLMEYVDPVAALAGKTVTGGRLNLAAGISGEPVDTDGDLETDVCDEDDDDDGCPDGVDRDRVVWSQDGDGDGFGLDCDCNDADPAVHPGAVEIEGNGLDDDCNPATPDQPGWGAAAAAEASSGVGSGPDLSAAVNLSAALALSLGAVLTLRGARRRRRRRTGM
ncbi:MAG: S8 family serine peptidase [bacterium]